MNAAFSKKITIALLTAVVGASLSTANPKAEAHWLFTDIEHVPWAQESILNGYQMGTIRGVGNSLFAPDEQVTREQFIKLITKGINPNVDTPLKIDESGPDVPWSRKYVQAAKDMGLLNAADALYNQALDAPITRGEMAVLMARAVNSSYQGKALEPAAAAAFCKEQNLLEGRDGGDLALDETLTRAEAAVVIDRVSQSLGIYKVPYQKPVIEAAADTFSLNGIKLGMTSSEVKAILGEPLYAGEEEAMGYEAMIYKELHVYLYSGRVSWVNYQGLDEELKASLISASDSAVFQSEDWTYFYYPATENLIIVKENQENKNVNLVAADNNFKVAATGYLEAVSTPAKAYSDWFRTQRSLQDLKAEGGQQDWRLEAALANADQALKKAGQVKAFAAGLNAQQLDPVLLSGFLGQSLSGEVLQGYAERFAPFDLRTLYYSSSAQEIYVSIQDNNNRLHEFFFTNGSVPEAWFVTDGEKRDNLLELAAVPAAK